MERIIPILLFLSVFGVGKVLACSCMVNGTVSEAYSKAANVVILKARSVEKTDNPPPMLMNVDGIKQTTLTVEKVYKGSMKVGQELVFAQGGGADCVWTFSEESIGKEYLFYLGAKPFDHRTSARVIASTGQAPKVTAKETWVGSTCSRSGPVRWTAADILYLENRTKVEGHTRLSGVLTQRVISPSEDQPSSVEFLSDTKIEIVGSGKGIELKTDANGVFEVYDLPAGKYRVRPAPIDGFLPGENDVAEVEIKPNSQSERDFEFVIDSAIRGKFFDAKGRPLKDVCLKLLPARGKTSQDFYNGFDCTEADGSFEFKQVPAGSYVLQFNDDDEVTAAVPFRTFYYPNTRDRAKASEIEITPGTNIENLTVVAPDTADIITISGVLRMDDGKVPISDIIEWSAVEFIADGDKNATKYDPSSRSTPDSQGRFTIRILKGQKGKLYGTISAYPEKYVNCPKLEKLIPKSDRMINIVDIKTAVSLIKADADQIDLELRFPFPNCKQAKDD